jgi:hypothetical protein
MEAIADVEKPAENMPIHTDTEEVTEESPMESAASGLGQANNR